MAPGSQPLGPVSYLNSTAGYLVANATGSGFGQSNISVSSGIARALLTDYSSGSVLKYSQSSSGSVWSAEQTISSNLIGSENGLACGHVNGQGGFDVYFSDASNNVSRSTLSGGSFSASVTILAQQGTYLMGSMNCFAERNRLRRCDGRGKYHQRGDHCRRPAWLSLWNSGLYRQSIRPVTYCLGKSKRTRIHFMHLPSRITYFLAQ